MNVKQTLYNKVRAYIESELLRLVPELPDLERFQQLKPVDRYIESLKQKTENARRSEKLRILPEMLSWAENEP